VRPLQLALVAPEACEAHCRAEFPGFLTAHTFGPKRRKVFAANVIQFHLKVWARGRCGWSKSASENRR
jgi:hypothetical protein